LSPRSYDAGVKYAYMMSNRSKTIYTGVTGNLRQRVWQHKQGSASKFTAKYKCDRLVFFEEYRNPLTAIAREKYLKTLPRLKEIELIIAANPTWKDLSEGWYDYHRYDPNAPKPMMGRDSPHRYSPPSKENT
jgi:putative endonuclease